MHVYREIAARFGVDPNDEEAVGDFYEFEMAEKSQEVKEVVFQELLERVGEPAPKEKMGMEERAEAKLHEFTEKDLDKRFMETEYVVAASGFEKLALWNENREKYKWIEDWKQDSPGLLLEVGRFGGLPVTVCFFWDFLDGHRVMFYESTSLVTHQGIVEQWLKKYCNPYTMEPRRAHCNAMNFSHCIHALKDGAMTFARTLEWHEEHKEAEAEEDEDAVSS
jgi:hypothetical protein